MPGTPLSPNHQTFGTTIRDALGALAKDGYTGNFRVSGPQTIECLGCHKTSPADKARIDAIWRIEGVSDPADEEMVVAITCPKCQAKGSLLLTYGINASAEDAEVALLLKDRRSGRPTDPSA